MARSSAFTKKWKYVADPYDNLIKWLTLGKVKYFRYLLDWIRIVIFLIMVKCWGSQFFCISFYVQASDVVTWKKLEWVYTPHSKYSKLEVNLLDPKFPTLILEVL